MFRWQKSFRDHYCRSETDFNNHLEYIAYNPTKHGLPKDWPYVFTSALDLLDRKNTRATADTAAPNSKA